jgi:hypothetical protein
VIFCKGKPPADERHEEPASPAAREDLQTGAAGVVEIAGCHVFHSLTCNHTGNPISILGAVSHADVYLAWPYLLGLTLRAAFPRIAGTAGMVHELVELVIVNGTVK